MTGKTNININAEDVVDLHVFKGKPFKYPVVMGTFSGRDENQVAYLKKNVDDDRNAYTVESLCLWAESHGIWYYVIYPLSIKDFLKHPIKGITCLKMDRELKKEGLI